MYVETFINQRAVAYNCSGDAKLLKISGHNDITIGEEPFNPAVKKGGTERSGRSLHQRGIFGQPQLQRTPGRNRASKGVVAAKTSQLNLSPATLEHDAASLDRWIVEIVDEVGNFHQVAVLPTNPLEVKGKERGKQS